MTATGSSFLQARCPITGSPRWRVSEGGAVGRVFFVYAKSEKAAVETFRARAPAGRLGTMIWVVPDVEPWRTVLHEGVYSPETRAG